MPTVKVKSGDQATSSSSEIVDGQDQVTVVTTRNYQTVKAIDDILTLVGRPEMYPGALVQGGSLITGLPVGIRVPEGKLAPLTYVLLGATRDDASTMKPGGAPQERSAQLPVKQFHQLSRFENLGKPSMATVEELRKRLMADVKVPAHYSKNMTYAFSSEHLNTQLGVTANFFSGSAGVNVKLSTDSKRAAVMLLLRQEYFKIAVEAPRLAGWFTPDIRIEDFNPKEVNKENPPCFVSNVGYGRLVCLLAESSEEYKNLEAALNFAYSSGFTSVKMDANLGYKKTLDSATYRLIVYGGDPKSSPTSGPSVKDFKGSAGLADLEKLIVPDFDAQYAMPISYEVHNLDDNRVVAIASASAHQLVNETSSPYRYQVRIDRIKIKDTFRSFLGLGIGHQDGEFRIDVKESKPLGTISITLDEGDHTVNAYLPLASGPRQLDLNFALWERNNGKGSGNSPMVDLAEIRREPGSSKSFGPIKFDKGNEASFTVIAIPPPSPKE